MKTVETLPHAWEVHDPDLGSSDQMIQPRINSRETFTKTSKQEHTNQNWAPISQHPDCFRGSTLRAHRHLIKPSFRHAVPGNLRKIGPNSNLKRSSATHSGNGDAVGRKTISSDPFHKLYQTPTSRNEYHRAYNKLSQTNSGSEMPNEYRSYVSPASSKSVQANECQAYASPATSEFVAVTDTKTEGFPDTPCVSPSTLLLKQLDEINTGTSDIHPESSASQESSHTPVAPNMSLQRLYYSRENGKITSFMAKSSAK